MDGERQELEEAWLSDSSMDEEEMEEIRKMKKDVERRMKQETELARMRIWKEMGLDDDEEEEQKWEEGYEGGDEDEEEEAKEVEEEENGGDELASAAALALAKEYYEKVRHDPLTPILPSTSTSARSRTCYVYPLSSCRPCRLNPPANQRFPVSGLTTSILARGPRLSTPTRRSQRAPSLAKPMSRRGLNPFSGSRCLLASRASIRKSRAAGVLWGPSG